jgi:hypothetical protein
MQPQLVWYWQNGKEVLNFGEHFVELLLAKMNIQPVMFDVAHDNHTLQNYDTCWLIVGSELHSSLVGKLLEYVPTVSVWGQGNGRGIEKALTNDLLERTRIYALRGPLTLAQLEIDPVPLCDPGFLMPWCRPMEATASSGYLYIPHHSNRQFPNRKLLATHADSFVDIFVDKKDIFNFMDRLSQAKFVLTNALHCLIFCLAYHIPCAPCLVGQETLNMPDKWQDVFLTLGTEIKFVETVEEGELWWEEIGKNLVLPDSQKFLEACPIYEH